MGRNQQVIEFNIKQQNRIKKSRIAFYQVLQEVHPISIDQGFAPEKHIWKTHKQYAN